MPVRFSVQILWQMWEIVIFRFDQRRYHCEDMSRTYFQRTLQTHYSPSSQLHKSGTFIWHSIHFRNALRSCVCQTMTLEFLISPYFHMHRDKFKCHCNIKVSQYHLRFQRIAEVPLASILVIKWWIHSHPREWAANFSKMLYKIDGNFVITYF